MSFRVAACPFDAVAPLARRAARDHVSLKDSRNTYWWAAMVGEEVVAAAGLMVMRGAARMKAAWTDPVYRKTGIGRSLYQARMDWCVANAVAKVQVISLHPSFYEANGFSPTGFFKGIVVLERVL